MKLPTTVKEVQEHIEKFESDIKAKDDALLEKKYMALRNNNTHQANYFQEQRDRLARHREAGLALLSKRLEAAKVQEEQEAAKQAALQAQQELNAARNEAQMKKLALAKWVQSGGSPTDFEAGWSVMYQQILQTKTMQKMVERPPMSKDWSF